MTTIQLREKKIRVTDSNSGKEYFFTDDNGQIQIDNIISFMNETDCTYTSIEPTGNLQMDNGLKFFIDTLLAN